MTHISVSELVEANTEKGRHRCENCKTIRVAYLKRTTTKENSFLKDLITSIYILWSKQGFTKVMHNKETTF